MSVPEENLNKCTLLVQRRSQALIDYYTMLFPPHFIYQSMQEREREIERERDRERERERERERGYDFESAKY